MPASARHARNPKPTAGLLEERRSSPGLLLALLGHHAMRRLREAHTAHDLSPRQFQLLGLVHDHGPMGQRELGQAMYTDPSILVTMLNPGRGHRATGAWGWRPRTIFIRPRPPARAVQLEQGRRAALRDSRLPQRRSARY